MSEDFVTSNCQAPLERMPWSSRKRLLVRLFLIIVATTVVVFLLLFPRHADVQVFDGRIEALGFEHSFGTNHILNGESKLAKRIKKDLSAVGLGVNISEHSLVTERDSHVFLLSYVAKSAELEPRRLCADWLVREPWGCLCDKQAQRKMSRACAPTIRQFGCWMRRLATSRITGCA